MEVRHLKIETQCTQFDDNQKLNKGFSTFLHANNKAEKEVQHFLKMLTELNHAPLKFIFCVHVVPTVRHCCWGTV